MNFRRNNLEKKSNFWFIKIIITFIIFITISWFYLYSNFKTNFNLSEDFTITIDQNDSFNNLWNKIKDLDNIWYKIYIKNNQPDFELKAWNYKIKLWSNLEETLKSLNKPIFKEEKITLLEGWNIFDIDYYLTEKWYIDSGEYISYAQNLEKIKALNEFFPFIWEQITLEWFLYPDTYKINAGDFKINNLVIKQLENFENKVYNKLFLNKQYDNQTITDIVNLASIVEKEEKNSNEKSTVAWILKKRLNNDWMIWADITVCYAYKLTSEECKMIISKYINEKTEYNTRKKLWLPKTPIWNPSFETIDATLNDKKTKYWFYLHNVSSWKIFYAETNAQHEQNKRLYMRN